MPTQKQKFALFSRLQELGFTYEEAQTLYRAQLTLHRWAEAECNGEIERDEKTGKPYRAARMPVNGLHRGMWPVADREAGALRRVKAVVDARNARERSSDGRRSSSAGHILFYHQTDPRGCALYLVPARELEGNEIVNEAKRQGCVIETVTNPEFSEWEKLPTSSRGRCPQRLVYRIPTARGFFYTLESAAIRWAKDNGKTLPTSRNLPIDQYYTRGTAICC